MASVIKWVEDAWWDSNNQCVATRVDTELEQILEHNQDLFFLHMVVEVDMGNTPNQIQNKTQTDLMSTGSISMFQLMATTMTQKTTKHNQPHFKLIKTPPNFGPSIHDDWNNAFGKRHWHIAWMPIISYASQKSS